MCKKQAKQGCWALCSGVGVVLSRGLEKGIPLTLERYVILDPKEQSSSEVKIDSLRKL